MSGTTPHVMTADEIREIIDAFVTCAGRLERAGFDGVELHGAHGYLLTQFLSPWSNHRQDDYGGSMTSRARIIVDIIQGIRRTCGADFVVGLKLSIHEFVKGGLTDENSREIVAHLRQTAAPDYIGVSQANFSPSLERHVPDMRFAPAPFLNLANSIRASAADIPLVFMGRVVDVEHAESILASDSADVIGLARALIADAHLPRKALDGDAGAIRPCIFCNVCWDAIHRSRPIACIYAPETGREREWGMGTMAPASTAKMVRIVGAGPAGLEAAQVAASRGHTVRVYDESGDLGGQLVEAMRVPGREVLARVRDYLVDAAVRSGAQFHLRVRVTPAAIVDWLEQGDRVLLATGAASRPPRLPGLAAPLTLEDALAQDDWSDVGVAIVDALDDEPTYAAAEALAARGARVHVLTPRLQIGQRVPFVSLIGTLRRLDQQRVQLVPLHAVIRLEGTTLIARHVFTGRVRRVQAIDRVVFAGPYVARDELRAGLRDRGYAIETIGDAFAPRRLLAAVLDGHSIGRAI